MSPISRGLLIMVIGIALMSVMDAIIKHLSTSLSVAQILFFRSLFGLVPLLIIASRQGLYKAIRTKKPAIHIMRTSLGVIAFMCFTLGVRDMSLANALAICFAAPFFMVLFSMALMQEQIGKHRLSAMLCGFCGVLIVLQPDKGIFNTAAPFLICTAAAYALSQVLARKYRHTESALSFSIWTTAGMCLFGLSLLPFYWQDITWDILFWCVAMGLFGGLAHFMMVQAVRLAPTAVVSPMEYTALIWAAVFDLAFWNLVPEHATLLGSTVIVASGIYILWRENIHQRERKTA